MEHVNALRYKLDILDGDTQALVAPSIPCSLEDLNGSRLEWAQGFSEKITCKFVIRHNGNMNATRNVVCNGETFQVDYVLDPGKPFRGVWMEVFAHRVNGGVA